MIKPWTITTFPKDKPVYIRKKGMPVGASLVVTIHPQGVNVLVVDGKGKTGSFGMTWYEMSELCEQWDGKPCGVET